MAYKLCTAEKPGIAKDIARVIGANKKMNGYYEGNGYLVTWAVGHLVGLAEPEEYGFVSQKDMFGDSKDKAYDELPLIPADFKLIVLEPTKEQFKIVKELMHRDDVEYIIDCGDMGAEGHILQWFIREKAGCKKPVKRFCTTSMTDEAIKEAMSHLRDAKEFEPIIRGEFCKKKADWILGMSLSRAESIKYHAGVNVGRVQSPTLGFVVKRFLEVQNFKITNYFTLDALVDEANTHTGFHVYWERDSDGIFPPQTRDGDGRVLDNAAICGKAAEIKRAGQGTVADITVAKKATDRPQLYDITELQRDANRKYGYTAAVTLATAQALYETQKVLSYPRTDSRYITTDLVPYMEARIKAIGTIPVYKVAAEKAVSAGLNIDKKIVDNAKVTDHHALIPTDKINGFNPSKMQPTKEEQNKGVTAETMQNVLNLVLCRMFVSFSPAYKYEQTNITVSFQNGMKFTASGRKPVSQGWKAVQLALSGKEETDDEDTHGEDEQLFPALQKGQTVNVFDCKSVAKKTSPPKLHTEATLLTAMENAGQQIENGAILKGKGIGTQATRAEIIKKLFDTGVVETVKKGKTNYIQPTAKGNTVIRILPPDVYSPKITADWETKIALIAEGKETEDNFMREFSAYIKSKTEQVKTTETGLTFKTEREVFGNCPWCGAPVYRFQEKNDKGKITETRYYCSDKCGWDLKCHDMTFMTRMGRGITDVEARKLIAKKFIVLDCKLKKGGGKYRGEFTFYERVSNEKKYCNVSCEPVKKKA
ncbi:putative topoisomerase (plasmid) [Oscillibacter valericigenes Sjm18-20]|nr:putative topoisomerase [Oscillibacter valericigenes Sjm18-20]